MITAATRETEYISSNPIYLQRTKNPTLPTNQTGLNPIGM